MTHEAEFLPSFDAEHFARAVGGDKGLMRHFAVVFLDNAALYIDDLRRLSATVAGDDGGSDGWRGAAHKLKGAATTVGAHRLAALCAGAETMDPVCYDRAEALGAIESEFKSLRPLIADLIPQK